MKHNAGIKLIECPRDAMQGIETFIPTEKKIDYLNKLLKAGFDTLDFGSYVSPAAIPQMRDTAEVLSALETGSSPTRLLAIVANQRGAVQAAAQDKISFLGYPFSVSETFQRRNTNRGIAESMDLVRKMNDLCRDAGKTLVVYLSMGFGNPYGDPWEPELVVNQAEKLAAAGIDIISVADTVGLADPAGISNLFERLIPALPQIEWGAHLHSRSDNWREKIAAAWAAGCKRFDGAIRGYGGCPMASDELVGNIATENLLEFARDKQVETGINEKAFGEAAVTAVEIFS